MFWSRIFKIFKIVRIKKTFTSIVILILLIVLIVLILLAFISHASGPDSTVLDGVLQFNVAPVSDDGRAFSIEHALNIQPICCAKV